MLGLSRGRIPAVSAAQDLWDREIAVQFRIVQLFAEGSGLGQLHCRDLETVGMIFPLKRLNLPE